MNKKTIINDPVYGFITIQGKLIKKIIEHPFFQRLRRIRQLGLTEYVYPGALHTRFHHALGAMHLMGLALQNLRNKGNKISAEEYEASLIAILLHDIGHGPFSHSLEFSLLPDISHEELTSLFLDDLNIQFKGKLQLAVDIFNDSYQRSFFHQLVTGQLDVDRLDYLMRDSFYTGVMEGKIGTDRIIKMIDIHDDRLVVEEKGIYSIENFLNARRLMYWQVYLHKTTVASEKMLIQLIRRARFLIQKGISLDTPPDLKIFLERDLNKKDFNDNRGLLESYGRLDDNDIWWVLKTWKSNDDKILALLSDQLLNRKLFKVSLSNSNISSELKKQLEREVAEKLNLDSDETSYLVLSGSMSNAAFMAKGETISILKPSGQIQDITEASDLPNIKALSKIVKKYYLCWPKSLSL